MAATRAWLNDKQISSALKQAMELAASVAKESDVVCDGLIEPPPPLGRQGGIANRCSASTGLGTPSVYVASEVALVRLHVADLLRAQVRTLGYIFIGWCVPGGMIVNRTHLSSGDNHSR